MVSSKVQLRKIRNLSDCLNDVFQFIKQEFKPLMRGFFATCGILILLVSIFYGLYWHTGMATIWKSIFQSGQEDIGYSSSLYGPYFYLYTLVGLITQAAVYTYIVCYLKQYEAKGNESPSIQEILPTFKKYLFPVFGYLFIFVLVSGIGILFCLAPGIYLGTVFMPFAYIMIMDPEKRQGSLINSCFTFIKGNFWPSLGVYFISALIYYFCSTIIGFIVGAVSGLMAYFALEDFSFVTGIVSGVLNIFSVAFSIILYLGIGMQYFSLEEAENGTGLMQRIESMGQNTDNNTTDTTNELP